MVLAVGSARTFITFASSRHCQSTRSRRLCKFMAADLRIVSLLSSLWRYALRLLRKGAITQVLYRLFQRVHFYWSIVCSGMNRGGKGAGDHGRKPQSKLREREEGSDDERNGLDGQILDDGTAQFTLVPNGEIVPLDQSISYSLFPFGDGIRDASRSSQNLAASRDAHSRAISLRSASRSHLGESIRTPSPAISYIGTEDERYTFVVQAGSPTLHTPTRRFSHSLPDLSNPPPFGMPPLNPLIRHRPRIDTSPPRRPSRITEYSEVLSPQEIERTSATVPSVESLRLDVCLDVNRIIPTMPEGNLRYDKRPRM